MTDDSKAHPLDLAAAALGSRVLLAERLGCKISRLGNWKSRGTPAEKCPDIEEATNGKVLCEHLRPDVNWHILRNGPRSMSAPPADQAVAIQVVGSPEAANDPADIQPGRA